MSERTPPYGIGSPRLAQAVEQAVQSVDVIWQSDGSDGGWLVGDMSKSRIVGYHAAEKGAIGMRDKDLRTSYEEAVAPRVRKRTEEALASLRGSLTRSDDRVENIVRSRVLDAYQAGIADAMKRGNCTYTLAEVKEMGWLPPGLIPTQTDEYHHDCAPVICPGCHGELLDGRKHGEGWCGPPEQSPEQTPEQTSP